jgi:aspartate racemase
MNHRRRPIIGILGGMGPEATLDLMRRVLVATPARDDCDHVHLLIDSNPDIPSRIAALIDRTGQDPGPELVAMAKKLEAAGAEALAIACNTAHAYGAAIRSAVAVPLIDMIDLTAGTIAAMALANRRVGMLASTAVINVGLYEKALATHNIAVAVPKRQSDLMAVIKAVKRGDTGQMTRQTFSRIASELADDGVDLLLIACTELSVLADSIRPDVASVDALDVLARAIVRIGLNQTAAGQAPAHKVSHR